MRYSYVAVVLCGGGPGRWVFAAVEREHHAGGFEGGRCVAVSACTIASSLLLLYSVEVGVSVQALWLRFTLL